MGNSTLVALALFALFLVYITARGRLPQYLAVFFGQVTSDQGGAGGSTAGSAVQGATGLVSSVQGLIGNQSSANTVFAPGTSNPISGGFSIGNFSDIGSVESGTGGLGLGAAGF